MPYVLLALDTRRSCPASPPVTNSRVFLEAYRGSNATLCQHSTMFQVTMVNREC